LAAVIVAAGVVYGPKVIDVLSGDQCSDVATMNWDEKVQAARKVLDNSWADYSDEPAGDWVDELVSYCATHPDDDLDDISPYGY